MIKLLKKIYCLFYGHHVYWLVNSVKDGACCSNKCGKKFSPKAYQYMPVLLLLD